MILAAITFSQPIAVALCIGAWFSGLLVGMGVMRGMMGKP